MASKHTSTLEPAGGAGKPVKFNVVAENGLQCATKIVGALLTTLATNEIYCNQANIESLCKDALLASGDRAALAKYEALKAAHKKPTDKKGLDILSTLTAGMTPNQQKNHALRFGLEDTTASPQNQNFFQNARSSIQMLKTSFIGNSTMGGTVQQPETRDYEDVTSLEILKAPICDIIIVQRGDWIPDGYYRISRTPSNKKANLNTGSGGNNLYLCIKKDLKDEFAPVTAITVFFPDRHEFVPPGFVPVRRGRHACNLNNGNSSERIFLACKRDKSGNPLTDLQIVIPSKNEELPRSFHWLDRSQLSFSANVNSGTSGPKIFVSYNQKYTMLECLNNERPLVSAEDSPVKRVASKDRVPPPTISKAISVSSMNSSVTGSQGEGLLIPPTTGPLQSSQQQLCHDDGRDSDDEAIGGAESSGKTALTEVDDLAAAVEGDSDGESVPDPDPEYMAADTEGGLNVGSLANLNTRRSNQVVVDCQGQHAPALHRKYLLSILTTLYVRHGPLAEQVVAGLTKLLQDTDFFENDLRGAVPAPGTVTMLDLMIECVCDRVMDTAIESEHEPIAQFLRVLVRHSSGRLSPQSVQKVFRVFGYVSQYYSSKHNWLVPQAVVNAQHDPSNDVMMFKVFRETIAVFVAQVEVAVVPDFLPEDPSHQLAITQPLLEEMSPLAHSTDRMSELRLSTESPSLSDDSLVVVSFLVNDFIDEVINNIEICRLCEATLFLVSKQSTAALSTSAIWQSISAISRKFFSDHSYRMAFTILGTLCRTAWQAIRSSQGHHNSASPASSGSSSVAAGGASSSSAPPSSSSSPTTASSAAAVTVVSGVSSQGQTSSQPLVQGGHRHGDKDHPPDSFHPRDVGIKLNALDALLEFLLHTGEKMKISKVMGYVVRRLVVACVLYNVQYALADHRIFAKLLKIITALWKVWRTHVRMEFAILCENLVIRVLQVSQLTIKPIFQMICLQEVVTWFDQPYLIVEMFVNYDMDQKFVSHWNVFSYLIRTMCAIARRTSMVTSAWDWRPTSQLGGGGLDGGDKGEGDSYVAPPVTARDVNLYALEEIGRVAKTLMDATGHAYLILQDSTFRSRSLGTGWEEDYSVEDSGTTTAPSSPQHHSSGNGDGSVAEAGVGGSALSSGSANANTAKVVSSVKFRRAVHKEAEELIEQAVKIYKEKDSLKKAVQFLVSKGFMANTPQEIASFLRVYKNSFDPTALGDFLGEGGYKNEEENEYWAQIRFRYIRAVSFVELELDAGLRLFLTGCGFRLPGEAQKVDRLVEVFVKAYWQDNQGSVYCPFQHPDAVHLMAFAMIMLNTDLHRAGANANKKVKKMTKDQFINNLRGVDQGANVDREYLVRIYDSIALNPIELPYNASESQAAAATAATAAAAASALTRTLSLAASSVRFPASSNASTSNSANNANKIVDEKSFSRDVVRGLRDAEDLLRSLSNYTYRFQVTGVDTNISLDLVSFMYETVWFHFHAITESLLATFSPSSDIYVIFAALDILCYSLTSSVFLDLKIEKMIFANQLMRFREDLERSSAATSSYGRQITDDSWFADVENVTPDTAMETIAKVHKLMVHLKDAMQQSKNYEITKLMASKIEKKANVLDNNTFFVRDGDLMKRSRTGRMASYHFFLFSDYLIYTHQGVLMAGGEYKVHEQLALYEMTVSDVDSDPTGCSLYINHPTKSFLIAAESVPSKLAWLRDISQTIAICKKREAQQQLGPINRRMSIIDRIESQQEGDIRRVETRTAAAAAVATKKSKRRSLVSLFTGSKSSASDTTAASDDSNTATTMLVEPPTSPISGSLIINQTPFDHAAAIAESATPTAPALTEEEDRALKKKETIKRFNESVIGMADKSLIVLFNAGADFWKGMISSRGGGGSFPDDFKQNMQLLGKQAISSAAPIAVMAEPDVVVDSEAAPQRSSSMDSIATSGASSNTSDEEAPVTQPSGISLTSVDQLSAIEPSDYDKLTNEAAMKLFLVSLFSIAPYWKYEQFL